MADEVHNGIEDLSRVGGIELADVHAKHLVDRTRLRVEYLGQRGHFWEQGYFYRTVGEQITADMVRNYIERHSFSQDQLMMFE